MNKNIKLQDISKQMFNSNLQNISKQNLNSNFYLHTKFYLQLQLFTYKQNKASLLQTISFRQGRW